MKKNTTNNTVTKHAEAKNLPSQRKQCRPGQEWLADDQVRLSLGFHWLEIDQPGAKYDREDFFDSLALTGMQSVTIEAKCELGYLYYDAAIGSRHPQVKGDYFGERLAALRSKGINVTVYFGCGGNYIDGVGHPEYVLQRDPVNVKPAPSAEDEQHCMMSLNSPYFDDVFLPHLKDFLSKYEIDAIWFDIFSIDPYWGISYDDATKELYQKEMGRPLLPRGEDPDPVASGTFFIRRASEVRDRLLSELAPYRERGMAVAISSHFRFLRHDGIKTDFLSRDTFRGYCGDIFESSYYARLWGAHDIPSEIISPITRWWGDWDMKSENQLIREAAAAVSVDSAYNLYGMTRADGRLNKERCRRIGIMKRRMEATKPWFTGGRPSPSAVLFLETESEEAFSRESLRVGGGSDLDTQVNNAYFTQTHECASKLLQLHGYDFGIRTDRNWQPDSNDANVKLLIAGNLSHAGENTVRILEEFIEGGGTLLLLGQVSEPVAKTLGIHWKRRENALARSYLRVLPGMSGFPDLEIPLPVVSHEAKFDGAQVLANLFPVVGEERHIRIKHTFGYDDADEERPYPSVFIKQQGKGKVIYFSFNFFTAYADEPSADLATFFEWVLRKAGFEKEFELPDAPPIEIVQWRSEDSGRRWLHLINHAEAYRIGRGGKQFPGEKIPTLHGLKLQGRGAVPQGSLWQPDGEKLDVEVTSGERWQIDLPPLGAHGIVELS